MPVFSPWIFIVPFAILCYLANPQLCIVFLSVVALLGVLRDFRIGLYALGALAFTQLASLEFLETYHVFLIVFSVTAIAYLLSLLRHFSLEIKEGWVLKWILGFLLIVWCSGLYAKSGEYWLGETYAFTRVLVLVFFVIQGMDNEQSLLKMARVIVSAVFVSSMVAFVQTLVTTSHTLAIVVLRFAGNLSDPNDYAMILVGALPLAVFLAKRESRVYWKAFYGVCSLSFLFFIVISQSRGGMLATGVSLFLMLGLVRRKWIVLTVFPVGIIAVLTIMPPELIFHRIMGLIDALAGRAMYDKSFLQRYTLLRSAITIFLENPVLGVGANNFIVHVVRFTSASQYAHNMFAEIAADLGLIGLVPFAVVILSPFFWLPTLIRSAESSGKRRFADLLRFMRISLAGMVCASLFLSCQAKVYLWVLVALVYAARSIHARGEEREGYPTDVDRRILHDKTLRLA